METVLKLYYTDSGGVTRTFPDGMAQAEIRDFTVQKSRMGNPPTITATLNYPVCLDDEWSRVCRFDDIYVEFSGERYNLKTKPSSLKNNSSVLYKHDLQFENKNAVLWRVYVWDSVDNKTPNLLLSGNAKVDFFGDINDFAERINQSMYFSGIGDSCLYDTNGNLVPVSSRPAEGNGDGYYIVVDSGVTSDEKHVSFANLKVSEALKLIVDVYGLAYYFKGTNIHVGEYEYLTEVTPEFTQGGVLGAGIESGSLVPFEYGHYGSALSVGNSVEDGQVYNRCGGTGGESNLPYYYPNRTPLGQLELEKDEGNTGTCESINIINEKRLAEMTGIGSVLKSVKDSSPDSSYSMSFKKDGSGSSFISFPSTVSVTKTWKEYSPGTSSIVIHNEVDEYLKLVVKVGVSATGYGAAGAYGFTPNLFITNLNDASDKVRIPAKYADVSYEENMTWLVSKKVYRYNEAFYFARNPNLAYSYMYIVYKIPKMIYKDVVGVVNGQYMVGVDMSIYNYGDYDSYGFYTLDSSLGEESEKLYPGEAIGLGYPYYGSLNPGDLFYVRQQSYIAPQPKLMPSCFRASLGKQLFYPAINYPYAAPSGFTPNTAIGERVSSGLVLNDNYKDRSTYVYHVFENTYKKGNPRENIFEYPDINPTIEGMTNASGRRIDMFADVAFDTDDDNSYYTDESGNMVYNHPYFFVKLREFNTFNLFEQTIEDGEMTIAMKSGKCAPCEFVIGVLEGTMQNPVQVDASGNLLRDSKGDVLCGRSGQPYHSPQSVQNDTRTNEVWIALRKDINTYGEIFPYNNGSVVIRPDAVSSSTADDGDMFSILHINLPQAYVDAAEQRLTDEIIKSMAENNSKNANKSLNFSRVFLGKNSRMVSFLGENIKVLVKYNGVAKTYFVSSYTYRVNDTSPIPEITIEGLCENVEEISSVKSASGGWLKKMVSSQVESEIELRGVRMAASRFVASTGSSSTSGAERSSDSSHLTPGTVLVADYFGNPSSIPNGNNGQVMKMVGGEVVWGDEETGGSWVDI